jgi:tetratricopeptide (TPR) repeat protein
MRGAARLLLVLLVILPVACAGPGGKKSRRPSGRSSETSPAPAVRKLPGQAPPFHLEPLASSGDAARRASVRIVLDGLDADADGDSDGAVRTYQRALQVDPANPYAYLCLARTWIERGDPVRALTFLDKADALLGAQRARDASVEGVVVGLRASALGASGRDAEARPLLDRARAIAPDAWADGRLDARELR